MLSLLYTAEQVLWTEGLKQRCLHLPTSAVSHKMSLRQLHVLSSILCVTSLRHGLWHSRYAMLKPKLT